MQVDAAYVFADNVMKDCFNFRTQPLNNIPLPLGFNTVLAKCVS